MSALWVKVPYSLDGINFREPSSVRTKNTFGSKHYLFLIWFDLTSDNPLGVIVVGPSRK